MRGYTPSDRLYLWWLGDPSQPMYIGELHLVRTTRGVSLPYDEAGGQAEPDMAALESRR
jgi:hypothetical protein